MLKYQKGYIFDGSTFVVNKYDIHNARDDQFIEATALLPGWISVHDRLPEVEKEVLILCNRNGHPVITTAMYEDETNTTEDSEWFWNEASDFCKYDEENDCFIIPEGWWEYRHFNPDDVYNNAVDIPVTHWMPLPEPPEV